MKKHRGGGTTPSGQQPGSDTCAYVNAKGGRCRMLIVHPGEDLCPHHLNQQRRAEQRYTEQVSANLLQNMLDFSSPTSVNIFLGNLLRELTLKRIDRKDAIAMAYIGQLLLNSHADIDRFYKLGFHEENPTAKIRLADKRIQEALCDGRDPSPRRTEASPPAATPPPPEPQSADETKSLSETSPDPQKIM
jgi:hypothetical protein